MHHLFQKSHSTGVTAAKLGYMVPPEFRIPDIPASLHHRVIMSDFGPFAEHGDSAAGYFNRYGIDLKTHSE